MARLSLCKVLRAIAHARPSLEHLVDILDGMNAVIPGRVDLEPNFDARFQVTENAIA